MKTLFVDTNLFLQCKSLEELPWYEISDGNDYIVLLISPPVISEIDRLKSDRNSRRAKRARKANSLFREILHSDEQIKVVRDTAPHVEITFSPPLKTEIAKPESLDLNCMDDKIIYEVYVYAQSSFEAALLTNDTSPMLKAQRCGLNYFEIPDGWLLSPEPDERDKQISKLELRIKKLESASPQIEMEAQDINGRFLESLLIKVITYDHLSDQKIKELVEEAGKRSPLVKEFKIPSKHLSSPISFSLFKPPSEEKIRAYKEEEYPEWLNKIKSFYASFENVLEAPCRQATIFFVLKNSGIIPAENVRVKFRALGGGLFIPPQENIEYNILKNFPIPPSPPEGELVSRGIRPSEFRKIPTYSPLPESLTRIARNKDRNAFYWKNGKPDNYENSWVFECDEFRHQLEPETFTIRLFVPKESDISGGAIECIVSASNLPEPFKLILPIKIEYIKGNTEAESARILDEVLPKITIY